MQDGDTVHIYAVTWNDVDAVKLLVDHGAAVDIGNKVTIIYVCGSPMSH